MYGAAAPQLSDSNRRIIETNGPSKRVYQVWKGSNRFFLGGRLIFGPDARSLILTVLLIVIPVILFGAFVSPKLVSEFQHQLGDLIIAIVIIFTVHRFFLGGRLIFGPDARSLILTVLLIVIPVILFGAFVSPKLVSEFQHQLGDLIIAIVIIFTVHEVSLVSYAFHFV
ncbi:hypothetical protein COCNU_scaffold015218G000010 [Cocos nucifera]|nr:hypothetical protein [Cocos nucifera]